MDRKVKAASVSIISNTSLLALKVAAGLVSGSVSVLSSAADSLNDLIASVIAFFSVRVSRVPADPEHPYGHGKIENISGLSQAFLIFVAAIYVIYEAVRRIVNPQPIETPVIPLAVMGITALTNLLVSRYLLKVATQTESAAIKADAYHLTTDVWTALGVFAGLILVEVTGLRIIDPIIALMVAATILRVAFLLTMEASHVLMDTALPEEEVGLLRAAVLNTPKVVGYHRLRARRSGSSREIDFHLIVPADMSVTEAHDVARIVEDKMARAFPDTNIVTHIEPDTPDILAEPETQTRRRPTQRRINSRTLRSRRRPPGGPGFP